MRGIKRLAEEITKSCEKIRTYRTDLILIAVGESLESEVKTDNKIYYENHKIYKNFVEMESMVMGTPQPLENLLCKVDDFLIAEISKLCHAITRAESVEECSQKCASIRLIMELNHNDQW